MAIIDASGYKTFKGISASTYDAQLAVIVPQAFKDMKDYTGRTFSTATFTEKHDGNNQASLTLWETPITSLTSVTLTTPSGSSSSIPTTAFAYDANSGVLKFDPPGNFAGWVEAFPDDYSEPRGVWEQYPVFPKGHQNVTVVYVGGYSDGDITSGALAGLQAALYQYVDVLLGNALLAPGMMPFKSKGLGNYNWTRADPQETENILVRLFYRFKRLGGAT